MKAAEDFLEVVLHGNIAAAECLYAISAGSLSELSQAIVDKIFLPSPNRSQIRKLKDRVFLYPTEIATLGLLWTNFHDATREGDGDRLVHIKKFLLLVFKTARRKNYSIEALNIQLQAKYTLSPRQAVQVKWSHYICNF